MEDKLEVFKKEVERLLISRVGEERAKHVMEIYEEDFQELFDKGLSPMVTVTALLMGY